MFQHRFKRTGLTALALVLSAAAAQATTLNITVTNLQSEGGLSATPLYLGFHNGSFDAFDNGGVASAGLKEIAETGSPAAIAAQRRATDPNSQGLVLASPDGPPPIQPGETVSGQITLEQTGATFLSFLSMVLPSNDTFIGNDDAYAYQVLDDSGSFVGPFTIDVTGNHFYDAGTEANGLLGSAFVRDQDISLNPAGEGTISLATTLAEFAGATLATGDVLGDAAQLDFASDRAAFGLLSIAVTEVAAPVPLPASGLLLGLGLGLFGWVRRKA
ncbi:spondin domain-containing protein [Primorskyibacter sp. S187A]|uniref:spondin domain-containing protein n=1 Tax=Primorskyibacter sp. S187A TaxID=3415130 RepID=UPI003C7C7BCF